MFVRCLSFVLFAVLDSAILISPISAQSKSGASSEAPARISDAELSEDGSVQIKFNNGRSVQLSPERGHPGLEQLQVSAGGRSVGWLIDDAPVGSYSVPTTLAVYTVGKPLRHFGADQMLVDWHFVDDKHIEFSSSAAHGPGTDWVSKEVHDIETGRLLRRWVEQSVMADTYVPLASIRGRATDSRGVPLTDIVVSIRAHPSAEPFALAMSSEGGQFTLQGISAGQHELRFEHRRFKTRTMKVTVGPSAEAIDLGTVRLERQHFSEK
jgi:hypothetical protein